MLRPSIGRTSAAGVLGCVAFLLIGWSSLLVPSLIRSIRETFGQTDAGIGLYYFVYAVAYAVGSFGGGLAVERLGRRVVLSIAAALLALGLLGLGSAPAWVVFLLAGVPVGLGAGAIDGGGNGLFLDLFRSGRGRALNALHVFFSLGALGAPFVVGVLVSAGVPWPSVLVATAVAAVPVAVLFAVVPMPAGRRGAHRGPDGAGASADRPAGRLAVPLLLLAFAIGCYVASEAGVSSWLVRFLDRAPIEVATGALSLLWGGLTVGRLVGARLADRFDHLRFTVVCTAAMSASLLAAIVVPSLPLSIALFALSGFASGPIFPMIMALAGERYQDRSAAVSGFLAGCAVAGSVVYPPIMGFLSVSVGLTVAMLGNVALGLGCLAALVLVGRQPARAEALAA